MRNCDSNVHREQLKILITCCLIYGAVVGLIVSCNGQFYHAIAESLQVPIGNITAGSAVMGISSLFFTQLFVRQYRKRSPRGVVLFSLALYIMSNYAIAYSQNLGHYYLCSFLRGAGQGFLIYYLTTDLIKKYYGEKSGRAISITVFSSGLIGVIANWVIGNVIEQAGWEAAIKGSSLLALAVSVPCVILFLKKTPEEGTGAMQENRDKNTVTSADTHFSALFVTGLVMAVFWIAPYCYTQHLKVYAISEGFGQVTGGRLLSVTMAGNLFFKFLLSLVIEKIGVSKSADLIVSIVAVSFLILLIPPTVPSLFISAFLLGASASQTTVLTPQVVSLVYRGSSFQQVYAHYSTALSLSGAVWIMLLGVFYSAIGSYRILFVMGLVIHLSGTILMIWFVRNGIGQND